MTDKHYLLIDCETNALPRYDRLADSEGQPRLAQFAMIMIDHAFKPVSTYQSYIYPDDWEMLPDAQEVNGLTTEFLKENGKPIGEVLDAYEFHILLDGFSGLYAFGARFDTKIMRGEFRRAGREDLFEKTPNGCIMQALTAICRIPQKNGRGLKWPTLREAMNYFDLPFVEKHSAPEDVDAAFKLLCKLKELDALPEIKVHYAKQRPTE